MNPAEKGFYLLMNAITKIEMVRDLAKSKILELQPFAGEEMNLLETDPHRTGFVDGERALAQRILTLLDDDHAFAPLPSEPVEDEMVMSLGQS